MPKKVVKIPKKEINISYYQKNKEKLKLQKRDKYQKEKNQLKKQVHPNFAKLGEPKQLYN